LNSIFAFVFVLGILIFVHELGHFMMARRIGVRVLTFSLGFGPKILKLRRGDTEYCVSAIPLGGYVKMAGENPEDTRTGASDEFLSKSKWQRFQVLVMGPVMNIALAIVVMAGVLYQGAPVAKFEREPVVVGGFAPHPETKEPSPAERAGVQIGDRIVSVNGEAVDTWNQLNMTVVTKAGRSILLGIDRGGRPITVDVTPRALTKFEMGDIGILPTMNPEVINVLDGSPADEAGLQVGDVVLAVNGERRMPHEKYEKMIETIRAGKPIVFDIKRGDQRLSMTITPRPIDDLVRIGANFERYELERIEPGPLQAVGLSLKQNWEWSQLIVKTLAGLFTRETNVKQLMGPVAIAQVSGTAAEAGWLELFGLMAMISLNLGLLNLMPIPVLDGGHILILALEGLSRKDFSMKVKEKMLLAGFVLLLTLMVTVIYNDLTRIAWIERLMPWR
jgi:regulator of sigma E protease